MLPVIGMTDGNEGYELFFFYRNDIMVAQNEDAGTRTRKQSRSVNVLRGKITSQLCSGEKKQKQQLFTEKNGVI